MNEPCQVTVSKNSFCYLDLCFCFPTNETTVKNGDLSLDLTGKHKNKPLNMS